MYRLIVHAYDVQDYNEDLYIAAKQVSQYTMGTYCISIDDSYTYLDYDEQENIFILDDNRLVKKPGFEILVSNIDDVSFSINDNMIYMTLERDEKDYTFMIGYYREKNEEEEIDEEITEESSE